MRCTQVMGLSAKANAFLFANGLVQMEKCRCPHCAEPHVSVAVNERYKDAAEYGMFDDGPMLYKHWLKDGKIAYEYVQASPWSSGPCIFIALASNDYVKDNTIPFPIAETLWSIEEINNA